jgi:hypothetical protein
VARSSRELISIRCNINTKVKFKRVDIRENPKAHRESRIRCLTLFHARYSRSGKVSRTLVRSLSSFGRRRPKRILTCSHAIECSCNLSLALVGEDQAFNLLSLSRALLRWRLIFIRTLVRLFIAPGGEDPALRFTHTYRRNSYSDGVCRTLVRSLSSFGRRIPKARSLSLSRT